jgi:hypothetical protein
MSAWMICSRSCLETTNGCAPNHRADAQTAPEHSGDEVLTDEAAGTRDEDRQIR